MDADARPRIFISSLIAAPEFRLYRDAAAQAIERAGCQVVRAEDHPARPVAPHTAHRYLVQARMCVMIAVFHSPSEGAHAPRSGCRIKT
jgi:hypothetical protein